MCGMLEGAELSARPKCHCDDSGKTFDCPVVVYHFHQLHTCVKDYKYHPVGVFLHDSAFDIKKYIFLSPISTLNNFIYISPVVIFLNIWFN